MMSGEQQTPSEVSTASVSRPSRRSRRACGSQRRNSDVIEVDANVNGNPPSRRRRRDANRRETENSVVIDLTCTDDIVDLTAPSPEVSAVEVPVVQLISDEEAEDFDFSPDSGTKSLSCPVCMEKFSKIIKAGGQIKSTVCGHIFCGACISKVLFHSKKCPSCRKKLDGRKVHNLYLPL